MSRIAATAGATAWQKPDGPAMLDPGDKVRLFFDDKGRVAPWTLERWKTAVPTARAL